MVKVSPAEPTMEQQLQPLALSHVSTRAGEINDPRRI